MSAPEACDECGLVVVGGRAGCRARFEEALARDFSDARYFAIHRLFVDCYCLQHPKQFCRSAKSLAAHLVGLASVMEGGAAPSVGSPALREWLDGSRELDKPALPDRRGRITIGALPTNAPPAEWCSAVEKWAESIWAAYAELQPLAREWMASAQSEARR